MRSLQCQARRRTSHYPWLPLQLAVFYLWLHLLVLNFVVQVCCVDFDLQDSMFGQNFRLRPRRVVHFWPRVWRVWPTVQLGTPLGE